MLGKTDGKRRRGQQRMRWLYSITNSMDMNLSKLWDGGGQRGLACYSSWGHKELNTTEWLNVTFVCAWVLSCISCIRLFASLWIAAHQLPCPSPSLRLCSNSCPLSQWCHPTISSPVAPFSCPQTLPASGSFLTSWLFTSSGQNIGVSPSVLDFL